MLVKWMQPLISLRIGCTLLLATIGGWIFYLLHLPLPWMLGAMVVTMIASITRLPLARTRPLRAPFAAVIGVALGATFQPAAFEQGGVLLLMIPMVIISTLLCGIIGYQYLHRVAGFDPVTAYFAAMPAGIQEMTLQGGLAGGDERRIALVHGSRIFLLVLVVPIIYAIMYKADSQNSTMMQSYPQGSFSDWSILIAAGLVGWGVAKALHIPNAPMIGPLVVSAIIHLAGVSSIAPPPLGIVIAQVVLGSSLGTNFIGTGWMFLWRSLQHGLLLVPVFAIICFAVALIASPFIRVDSSVLFLALSPGGTTEMSLIALALQANVALVTSSQLIRILLVNLGAVSLFRAKQSSHRQ